MCFALPNADDVNTILVGASSRIGGVAHRWKGDTVRSKDRPRTFPISILLPIGSPPTITRSIISRSIRESINRILEARPLTHVGEEVFKLAPAGANRNANSAVLLICREVRIGASLDHHAPRPISRCAAAAMRRRSLADCFPTWTDHWFLHCATSLRSS